MDRKQYLPLIRMALAEDLGKAGDVTSLAIFPKKKNAAFTLLSKDDGILCGMEQFSAVFAELDRKISVEAYFRDGDALKKGDVVARVRGNLTAILSGERTSLNIVSHLSGIATKTAALVRAAGKKPIVLDTRKTIPGMRYLQKYAVATGGGQNHRMGLFDMVLIKDNHVDAAGGIANAVRMARERWGDKYKIEVETRNLDEVREAVSLAVDRIMLDNMDDATMKEAVEAIAGRAETEASGNMTIERLKGLAETGVDFVSFGELTHTVKIFDFSLKQESCE
ncbi:MAG TPA: carboxylating nicotinate-nucleotide diphosphorylase [Treponemataceae bacterium]|nr:carboxylating nicotinate-nucleotide diphosphorylase [Treponemataceae bacterium]